MTQITPELLNAVMAKQGAPNTTDNLNRIAEFAAVHPGILEQYIGKGTDASQVGNSITNSIASTDGVAPRGLADPNGYLSTVDKNTGASNIAPRLTKTPEPTGASGRGAAPKKAGIPGDFNAPVGAPPFPKAAAPATASSDLLGTGDSLGVPWWLAPFAARYLSKPQAPSPQLPPPFVQTPQGGLPPHLQQSTPQVSGPPARQALPSADVPTYPSGAPQITPNDINAATRDEVQKQVDAENLKNEMKNQNAKPRTARPARPGIR